jgi:hypothetical protein
MPLHVPKDDFRRLVSVRGKGREQEDEKDGQNTHWNLPVGAE